MFCLPEQIPALLAPVRAELMFIYTSIISSRLNPEKVECRTELKTFSAYENCEKSLNSEMNTEG